jgi:carbamoyl-phosphate synthase large subunit
MPKAEPTLNVLVTSASRKVLLVRAFQEATRRVGGGRVVAVDTSANAAALYEADGAHLVPRSDAPEFVDVLLRLCADEQVGLIVPTRDGELPVFAQAAPRFREQGVLVLVSAPDAVTACLDKALFASVVADTGLDTPRIYPVEAAPLPAFVKPRMGSGGHGARRVETREQLAAAIAGSGRELLVQEAIDAPEYTVDLFLDLDGHPISCVPRERVLVVAGESVVSRTVRDPELVAGAIKLARRIGLIGHVTVQAFRTPERVAFFEINPRYGGAANLSFAAGAFSPEYALRLARGERVEARLDDYRVGLVMLRHSEDRFVAAEDLHVAEAGR